MKEKSRIDSAQVIPVIRLEATDGRGTYESPSRGVIQYWSLDGQLLAVQDEWKELNYEWTGKDKEESEPPERL